MALRERKIPEEVIRLCQAKRGTAGVRPIARELGISRESVRQIWRRMERKAQVEILLTDGERLLERPVNCENGHRTQVRPCRECIAEAHAKERNLKLLNVICPKCKAARKRQQEPAREDQAQRIGTKWRCVVCNCLVRNATPAELAAIARSAAAAASRRTVNGARTAGPTTSGAGTDAASA